MNSVMTAYYPVFEMYQSLRAQLLETITDEDLGYRPVERTLTLGELCREIGEVEYAYIQSFKTFTIDFSYKNPDLQLERSVAALQAWYADLDQELKDVIAGLSEDDVQNRVVDRGSDFKLPVRFNLNVYQEALLIFYGKTSVYLRALDKLPSQWQEWIG